MFDDRGQAHTLEAFMAALLLLAGLLFSLQATAVTPLSASTSNQHIENQQRAMARDLLATADRSDALEDAILNWTMVNGSGRFTGTESIGYYQNPSAMAGFGRFGTMLNSTFLGEGIAVNIWIRARDSSGSVRNYDQVPSSGQTCAQSNAGEYCSMLYMGSPSDNAVVATRSVTILDQTQLTGSSESVATAAGNGDYFAPDAASGDHIFNVVEVRIVVWQM